MKSKEWDYCLKTIIINLKSELKKKFLIILVTTIAFIVEINLCKQGNIGFMEALTCLNGGYDEETTTLLEIMISIFQYLGIYYICFGFLEQAYSLKSQLLFIRIKFKGCFEIANLFTCLLTGVIMSFIYDIIKYMLCMACFPDASVENLVHIFVAHIIGNIGMISMLFIIFRLTRNIIPALITIVLMFLITFYNHIKIIDEICLGDFVMLGKMDFINSSGISIIELFIKHLIVFVIAICVCKRVSIKQVLD